MDRHKYTAAATPLGDNISFHSSIRSMESFFDMCSSPLLVSSALPQLKLHSTNSMEEFFNTPAYKDWPSEQHFFIQEQQAPEEPSEQFILNFDEPEQKEVRVFDLSRKVKRPKKKPDYKKNICGYVTKRSIRECLSETYRERVTELCRKHNCAYEQLRNYYLSRIENVTGPRHLPMLLVPENEQEVALKGAFREFFEWFIKQRYVRYLMLDGKMANKKAYISFKNEVIARYLKVNLVRAA